VSTTPVVHAHTAVDDCAICSKHTTVISHAYINPQVHCVTSFVQLACVAGPWNQTAAAQDPKTCKAVAMHMHCCGHTPMLSISVSIGEYPMSTYQSTCVWSRSADRRHSAASYLCLCPSGTSVLHKHAVVTTAPNADRSAHMPQLIKHSYHSCFDCAMHDAHAPVPWHPPS
jgi:hypothetical protein